MTSAERTQPADEQVRIIWENLQLTAQIAGRDARQDLFGGSGSIVRAHRDSISSRPRYPLPQRRLRQVADRPNARQPASRQ